MVTSSNQEIKVWRLIDSNEYIEKFSIGIDEGEANLMAMSKEGHLLAFTGKDWELKIWRISEEEFLLVKNVGPLEDIQQLDFSYSGKMLACTS